MNVFDIVQKMRDSLRKNGIIARWEQNLFLEAWRRKVCINGAATDKPLNKAWVGLGTPSRYKSTYFKTFDGITTPRVNHWWVLTTEGCRIYQEMDETVDFALTFDEIHQLNEYIFDLKP